MLFTRHTTRSTAQINASFCLLLPLLPLAYSRSLLISLFSLQAGDRLNLEWERGRVFDQDVGQVFAAAVKDAGSLRVQSVTAKEDRKPRPPGLNTVELLKTASSALNIGPAQAMAVSRRGCSFVVAVHDYVSRFGTQQSC